MKIILSLILLAAMIPARGATYLQLSQTNAFATGIVARAGTNAANWTPVSTNGSELVGTATVANLSVATNASVGGLLSANSAQFTNTPTVNGVPVLTNAAAGSGGWALVGTTNTTITGNAIQGVSTGTATNPASSVYGPGLSIYGTGSVDPYVRLHRGDEVLGLDIWSDSSTGNAYFDHQHNSDATGFLFRRKIRSGTPVIDFGMIGTNAGFYGNWQFNASFIGVTNKWKLKDGVSTHPTFQSSGASPATRLYLIPQSTPASGLVSGIKMFGSNFDADMVNYDDFGIYNSVDGNYINNKTNGTGVLKPLFFTKQDAQVAMWIDYTNMVVHVRTMNATNGYSANSIAGITTTWTNMISGVITQRISTIGGIVVTNLTL